MIRQDLSALSSALRDARVPFVHARVVLAERPTSAKPGDEAIILEDGTVEGFVGGECASETVLAHALEALPRGETVLLRITPDPEPDQPGKRVVHNPCLSGGTLEIFLEPSLPPPLVHVVGDSPIARALLALGRPLGYALSAWEGQPLPDTAAVVVASHGKNEEGPLVAALQAGVPYVGLVASGRRGAAVVSALPVSDELKATVHTPAGLDIGAATAEEIALSILAEIVASQPRRARSLVGDVCTELDPVCGMKLVPGDDTLHTVESGRTIWFCGPGCQKAYLADPAAYPVRRSGTQPVQP